MPSTTDRPPWRSPLRILLAEDSLVQQQLAAEILQKDGHRVRVTSNGQEAVEALADQEFDLVLMDVEMPVMDGLQAVSAIRKRETQTGGHVPVVAITSTPSREQCLAAGMDAFVTKPLCPDALSRTMQQVLGF
jgi:CheY-like chemotaxis protein